MQTALIMEAVKHARTVKGWSAQQLADEMTASGVPWNRSVVENLEYGRRKSLRVHELMCLAFVLDMDSPLDLLVPGTRRPYPVTPHIMVTAQLVQEWCQYETGPLGKRLSTARRADIKDLGAALQDLPEDVRDQVIAFALATAAAASSGAPVALRMEKGDVPEESTDGQD